MNWIKSNKFLFGFLVVMVIGVGALGYLAWSAKAQHDEALETYQTRVNELTGLQKRPVFPGQKNLDKLVEQKKQVTEKVGELAKALAAQQIPVEEITPSGFQDKLKAAVNGLKEKAAKAPRPVKLGGDQGQDRFFLGFEMYETAPPDAGAAGALGRQLKVIEWVVGELIDSGVTEISAIHRPELPEEKGKGRAEERAGAKPEKHSKVAVRKDPFEVAFLAEQGGFKQALNGIVEYKGQFLIPRLVIVKNTKDKVPRENLPGFGAPPPPPDPNAPPAAPGAPVPPPPTKYIVGEEKVEIRLLLEAVEFAVPAPTAAK
ncbi:MAG: Amuc_1100 family pilus-like protein [Opitutaceae bacterium]